MPFVSANSVADHFGDWSESVLSYAQAVDAKGKSRDIKVPVTVSCKVGAVLVCLAEQVNCCVNAVPRWIGNMKPQFSAIALAERGKSAKEQGK